MEHVVLDLAMVRKAILNARVRVSKVTVIAMWHPSFQNTPERLKSVRQKIELEETVSKASA